MTTKITNYPETLKNLAAWIEDLKEAAREDRSFSIAWFGPTVNSPFSIVAGWEKRFANNDFSDLFCTSKSNPEYVMCVKVAINEGPYAYTDFEVMNMPSDPETGDVDDTCIPLEWDDPAEVAAQFFLMEWERILQEHEETDR